MVAWGYQDHSPDLSCVQNKITHVRCLDRAAGAWWLLAHSWGSAALVLVKGSVVALETLGSHRRFLRKRTLAADEKDRSSNAVYL